MGYDPMTHRPRTDLFSSLPNLIALASLLEHHQLEEHAARLQAEAVEFAKLQYLQCLLQSPSSPNSQTQFNNNNMEDLGTVLNSLNSISQIMRETTPSLNVSDFENQPTFSMENDTNTTTTTTTSQLLHHLIINTSNSQMIPNPQIPFDFQTLLNNNIDDISQNPNFNIVNQGENVMSNTTPNTKNPWIDLPSSSSSTLPPLTETSVSNIGDASSSTSNGEGISSSYWSELLFDQAPYMHEIS